MKEKMQTDRYLECKNKKLTKIDTLEVHIVCVQEKEDEKRHTHTVF